MPSVEEKKNVDGSSLEEPVPRYLIVELAINGFSICVNQLESMRSISIHVSMPIWNPTITE